MNSSEQKYIDEFKCLGSTNQSNQQWKREVKRKVQAVWSRWRWVSGWICDWRIAAIVKRWHWQKGVQTVISWPVLFLLLLWSCSVFMILSVALWRHFKFKFTQISLWFSSFYVSEFIWISVSCFLVFVTSLRLLSLSHCHVCFSPGPGVKPVVSFLFYFDSLSSLFSFTSPVSLCLFIPAVFPGVSTFPNNPRVYLFPQFPLVRLSVLLVSHHRCSCSISIVFGIRFSLFWFYLV